MCKDSPLSSLSYITYQDIIDKPLIVSQQQLDGNVLSGWLKQDVKRLNIVSTFNLITKPVMMVDAGLGHAVCLINLSILIVIVHYVLNNLNLVLKQDFILYEKTSDVFSCS